MVPPRVRLALIVLAVCVAAAVAVVAVASTGSSGGGPDVSGTGFAGALRPPGIPVQDFSLRDQDGRPATLSQYRGQPVVVTFMYSTCRDTCPIQAQQIRGALDDLGRDLPVLAISVDPAHDTPETAKAFLLKTQMTGRMRFLMGTRAQLAPIWRDYGIRPESKRLEHSAETVVLDKTGRQRVGFPADKLTPEGLAHDLGVLAR
jgi:protein SCO1